MTGGRAEVHLPGQRVVSQLGDLSELQAVQCGWHVSRIGDGRNNRR